MCFVLGQLVADHLAEHMCEPFWCPSSPHSYHYKVYLCYCLLFTEGYIVANTIAYLSGPQCLNVVPFVSTHQCQVDTTPSRIEALVPRFQEPLTADILSELFSAHEVHV